MAINRLPGSSTHSQYDCQLSHCPARSMNGSYGVLSKLSRGVAFQAVTGTALQAETTGGCGSPGNLQEKKEKKRKDYTFRR